MHFDYRGQDAEVTFIRGGHRPGSETPNGSASPLHNSPRRGSENVFAPTQLNLNGIENSSSQLSSSRSSQTSEADLSNTDIFMQELLAGDGMSHPAGANSRDSSPSVETFQGSPQSQISPPVLSDTQPAVLQPMTHPVQSGGNVLNHSGVVNSHPQPVNGFHQPPTAMPRRLFSGGFQPALSSTPSAVDAAPNGFVMSQQYGPWSSQPFVNGSLGSQPLANQAISFAGNGKFYAQNFNVKFSTHCYVSSCPLRAKLCYSWRKTSSHLCSRFCL